jgi:excisionase family DNA binding protein
MYSIEEVADMLNVNRNTVRRMLIRGELKGIKVGRLWRIKEEDLKEFLGIEDNEEIVVRA